LIKDILRARQAFSEVAGLEDPYFSLDRAALSIALEEYPQLDVEEYLHRLDTLAARVEVLAGQDRKCQNLLDCLNQILFVEEGLRGNTEDYYDPRNSFLNELLDRKQGIPISLSVVYIEVARRLNFPLHGVGFPGHFIVKCIDGDRELLIDPFNGSVAVQPSFLQVMDKKAIILRMLFNLKGIYYQKEEYAKALSVVDRILILSPGIPSEIRDRGLLYMQTSLFAKALADLEYYLVNTTSPEDSSNIQGHIKTLRSIVSGMN